MSKAKKPKSDEQIKRELEKKKKQWLQELESSEAIKNYLEGFNALTSQDFLKNYVDQKARWHRHADYYAGYTEKEQLTWINAAFEHLEMILQKKLFDAQCLWRAEKVTYPQVEICEDFILWERDVFNCPFIEPVNEEDIELYSLYLQQNNVDEDFNRWGEWQDYNEIKEAYNNDNANRDFPEWYDFHNGRTGSGVLMLLPDIRGEKEKFYCDLHFEHQRALNKQSDEDWEETRDKRPFISAYDEHIIKYMVSTFESKEELALYNEYAFANRNNDKSERLYEITSVLLKADEYVPIEAHYDWLEGLESALSKYKRKKIAEALPLALEQYQMNVQMGIAFPNERGMYEFRENWLKNILHGRKLNGEPEDLNF